MSVCLMLHGVGTPPSGVTADEMPYWVSEALFADIVALARRTGSHLTFDDGNATDAAKVLPALRTAGITASFFILTDRIGTAHYMSEDDIRTLHKAGMEIGSHGCDHVAWTDMSDQEIAADVKRSTGRLSQIIGEPVRTVAVPFGACDRRVLRVLRGLGVGRVYTSFRGLCSPDGWIVRRYCIKSHMTIADIKALVTQRNTPLCRLIGFLRTWRHAGRAALWTAPQEM